MSLLAPDGKSYTDAQINSFSIKRVFDMLIDLGVSDNGQYREHLRLNRSSKRYRSRSRSRSSSRSYSYPRKRSKPTTVYYYKPYPSRSISRKKYVVYYRKPSNQPKNPGVYRQKRPNRFSPSSGCTTHRSAAACAANKCYWTGASCLTP